MASKLPVIVIVGPTASGKTAQAIELARVWDGEILCADSRTVYKDMDIGTAKPTFEERGGVPHWGLDLVSPSKRYTAAEFKRYADDKIAQIHGRGRVPVIVGGTGLYVDAVIFDYKFPQPMRASERAGFEALSRKELIEYCIKNNIELPEDDKNVRRLLRAVSDPMQSHQRRSTIRKNFIVVGITTNKDELSQRIEQRTEHMFDNGVVDEATMLGKKYGWGGEAMTSNVYRVLRPYLEGELTLEEVIDKITTRDMQLAKRQMTWFRRNSFIEWCQLTEVNDYLRYRLATEYNL